MLKIAHRGHSDKHGDNNMQSFIDAAQCGFNMIELDIQLSKSGVVIVYHDTYLDGKDIQEYSLGDLMKKGIITLEFVLYKIGPTEIPLFLDIKGDVKVVHEMVRLLKKYVKPHRMRKIYVSGFNRCFVDLLKPYNLPINFGFTTENNFTINQLKCLMKGMQFVCLHWSVLDNKSVDYFNQNNILVFVYTCKDDYILKYIKKYNVDGIVSNYYFN